MGSSKTTSTSAASPGQESAAKLAWRKPVVEETACGCEINCYATSSGLRRPN
ncbi:MAG: pyrroloquinoline quinone precursor peptide PqqA [Myxococcales bacterium]|nr:pyrroloquinoline quinone precursor peptide PqqA [Myxococcales bacterium]MCH7867295.1 pyrroloquinoline quinone precursor peptide PqqA [Myxococcales bacterium]